MAKPSETWHLAADSWAWPNERWQAIVNKVRAGRSLKPKQWPGKAKVAFAFDTDHESSTLRWGKLSQGEYGSRVAVPRIKNLLARHHIKASFFVPAVIAKLHPHEQRGLTDAVMFLASYYAGFITGQTLPVNGTP